MRVYFENKDDTYPMVLLPNKGLNVLREGIDLKTVEQHYKKLPPKRVTMPIPVLPSRFYYVSKNRYELGCMSHVVILPISLLIGIAMGRSDGFIVGLKYFLGSCIFNYLFFMLIGEYPFYKKTVRLRKKHSDESFQKLRSDYEEKLKEIKKVEKEAEEVYRKEMYQYEEQLNSIRGAAEYEIFRDSLTPKLETIRIEKPQRRGASELRFLEMIKKSSLSELVYMDMAPYYLEGISGYVPDITIICRRTGLHIDIEIDEPYNLTDRLPIHYRNSADDERNRFFIESGWAVIRFAEEQIVRNGLECIKTIESIYWSLARLQKYYETNLEAIQSWSYEDSLIMMANQHREGYLLKR